MLVSGSQCSNSRVLSVRFLVPESKGQKSQVAKSQFLGPGVPSPRIPNPESQGPGGGGENVHANSPNMKDFDMPGTAQCSQWRRNSNNQHKLTMYSDVFPS